MQEREPYRICVVCSGNICRSPMGEVVLRQLLTDTDLPVEVDSAGIGDWHVGEPADRRTLAALSELGYDGTLHRAAWLDPDLLHERDLILVADRNHLTYVTRLARQAGVNVDIRLLRSYDPASVAADTLEVDDPYYGGGEDFTRCLAEVKAACAGVVAELQRELPAS